MKFLSRNEEIILLAIWRLKGNAYGVTIRELVSLQTGKDWPFGAIYMPLDKLTSKRYVRKYMSTPESVRGGRSKCLYELTDIGKDALKQIRTIQTEIWKDIPEMAFD